MNNSLYIFLNTFWHFLSSTFRHTSTDFFVYFPVEWLREFIINFEFDDLALINTRNSLLISTILVIQILRGCLIESQINFVVVSVSGSAHIPIIGHRLHFQHESLILNRASPIWIRFVRQWRSCMHLQNPTTKLVFIQTS